MFTEESTAVPGQQLPNNESNHYVKSVRIQSFSGACFPSFGPNTERYFVSLRIQSEYGKIVTKKTPNTDTIYTVKNVNISRESQEMLNKKPSES